MKDCSFSSHWCNVCFYMLSINNVCFKIEGETRVLIMIRVISMGLRFMLSMLCYNTFSRTVYVFHWSNRSFGYRPRSFLVYRSDRCLTFTINLRLVIYLWHMYWWVPLQGGLHAIHLSYIRCIALLSGASSYDLTSCNINGRSSMLPIMLSH